MTEKSRNALIGLTVLVGLGVCAAMIFAFAGMPEIFQTGYRLVIQFKRSHDIIPGDAVHLLDKRVGMVTSVQITDGDPRKGVTIRARVDSSVKLPTNIQAKVLAKGIVGRGYLTLIPTGPMKTDPDTGEPILFYPSDATIHLDGLADEGGGGGLPIPQEFTDALKNFGQLAENLNELLEPPPPGPATGPASTQPAEPPAGLKGTIPRLNRTLDSLYAITGDAENRQNIKTTLANLAEASAKAREMLDTMQQVVAKAEGSMSKLDATLTKADAAMDTAQTALGSADELARKLITDAERLDGVLAGLQKSVADINAGKGTAGKLLNDPKLYHNLVQTTENLDRLVQDFRRLAEKWEREGIELKLK